MQQTRSVFVLALGLAAVLLPLASPPLAADSCTAGIGSNFNGTPIAGGDFIWFNAVAKVKGVSPTTTTSVRFDSSTIDFTAAGTAYSLAVPASTVVFSPTASTATTTFDGASWTTTVPASYSGNVFLAGLPFAVPAGGLPGGINPVRWSGQLTSATPGLTVQWKWAAAVYTQFSTDPGALGVKPIDGGQANPYANSDHAGTPESFKPFVTGGARGGGGSNWTGSYSGTMSVVPCTAALEATKAFATSPVAVGQFSTFTITVTNPGTEAVSNLSLEDILDPPLQLYGATVTQGDGTCDQFDSALECQFSSLAPGATAQVTVRFRAGLPDGCGPGLCPVVNCATATDDAGDSATGCATVQILVIPE